MRSALRVGIGVLIGVPLAAGLIIACFVFQRFAAAFVCVPLACVIFYLAYRDAKARALPEAILQIGGGVMLLLLAYRHFIATPPPKKGYRSEWNRYIGMLRDENPAGR